MEKLKFENLSPKSFSTINSLYNFTKQETTKTVAESVGK